MAWVLYNIKTKQIELKSGPTKGMIPEDNSLLDDIKSLDEIGIIDPDIKKDLVIIYHNNLDYIHNDIEVYLDQNKKYQIRIKNKTVDISKDFLKYQLNIGLVLDGQEKIINYNKEENVYEIPNDPNLVVKFKIWYMKIDMLTNKIVEKKVHGKEILERGLPIKDIIIRTNGGILMDRKINIDVNSGYGYFRLKAIEETKRIRISVIAFDEDDNFSNNILCEFVYKGE